jgi:uncharacterized protein (TIGR00369 family)
MTQTQGEASAIPQHSAPAPASGGTRRTRTYSWDDPRAGLARLPVTAGLDLLRAMQAGEVPAPPLAATLDFAEFLVLGEGAIAVTLVPAEHHLNPLGTVHGGVLAALLDTAAGCAVHTTLPAGTGYTSLDLSTRFLRPVTPATGLVRAEGRVLSRGSRTATAEARLVDADGRLLAHATSTCLVFPLPAGTGTNGAAGGAGGAREAGATRGGGDDPGQG